jgi:hypothetical protein
VEVPIFGDLLENERVREDGVSFLFFLISHLAVAGQMYLLPFSR